MPGAKTVVVSRTLRSEDYPNITIISDDLENYVIKLREEPGKDIWLFGGGSLFHSLLDLGLVDVVEVGIIPVLLGSGIPLVSPPGKQIGLRFVESRVYKKTGTVLLEYAVEKAARRAVCDSEDYRHNSGVHRHGAPGLDGPRSG